MPHKRLFLALDVPSVRAADIMVKQLAREVAAFKVGSELFLTDGPAIADLIVGLGSGLFVDMKLHDIPRTVEAGAKSLAKLGADWITVHACGGSDMLKAAVAGASYNPKCRVLAVTVLTSQSEQTLREIGIERSIPDQVGKLADLAVQSGVTGFVCSPQEATLLRQRLGASAVLVCPGIRPQGGAAQDQKRIATPREAILAGADYLVVGRPILDAPDRRAALLAVNDEIAGALRS